MATADELQDNLDAAQDRHRHLVGRARVLVAKQVSELTRAMSLHCAGLRSESRDAVAKSREYEQAAERVIAQQEQARVEQ